MYIAYRAVTDGSARAPNFMRCTVRVRVCGKARAKGVKHQARTEQRQVIAALVLARFVTLTHPNVTFCNAERPDLDVAQSFNTNATLLSIADPHTRLRRHNATPVLRGGFHLRNATVNFELQRCEHDDRARVAQSETPVRPRG